MIVRRENYDEPRLCRLRNYGARGKDTRLPPSRTGVAYV